MKYTTTIIIFFLSILHGSSQECTSQLDEHSIISNDFRETTISSLANLFFEGSDPDQFFDGDGETTLFDLGFARGIWAGGISPSADIKLAASGYGDATGGSDFIPGPIWSDFSESEELCAFYKRVWSIDNFELAELIESYNSGDLKIEDIPADILEWPASNNPHIDYAADYDMAPFFDSDENGIYDPMMGDYPIPLEEAPDFFPSEFRFFVFNDMTEHNESQADPISMEFHVVDYVVNCIEKAESETSIYTRLKYIYKGNEDLFDFRIGIWDDSDLGCFTDDYVGSAPSLNTNYVYNSDGLDSGSCPGLTEIPFEFGVVRSLTFLDTELEGFIHFYNPSVGSPSSVQAEPATPQGYYNYLNGKWRDGTELTKGGTGYNPGSTDISAHAFTDNPSQLGAWTMQTIASNQDQDLRTISTFNSRTTLIPGEISTVDFVDHVMINLDKNRLDIFDDYADKINILKQEFEGLKTGTFSCGELPDPCQTNCIWPGDVLLKVLIGVKIYQMELTLNMPT